MDVNNLQKNGLALYLDKVWGRLPYRRFVLKKPAWALCLQLQDSCATYIEFFPPEYGRQHMEQLNISKHWC